MRRVYKYAIPEPGTTRRIAVPEVHKPIHVGQDPDNTWCVWFEVDDIKREIGRTLLVVGTGHPIPDGFEHCGSLVQGPFVWHVYHG